MTARVFALFATRYGRPWTNRFEGDEQLVDIAIGDWAQGLSHIPLRSIALALRESDLAFNDYPPTKGKFIDLAVAVNRRELELEQAPRKALPRPSHSEVSRAAFAKIRELLK